VQFTEGKPGTYYAMKECAANDGTRTIHTKRTEPIKT